MDNQDDQDNNENDKQDGLLFKNVIPDMKPDMKPDIKPDQKQDRSQNVNQDNCKYNNLNIHEQQNNININFLYYTSYLSYKKKIFLNINEDFKLISNLFNDNLCEILINIYILKKKNKISDKHFHNLNFIFDFIFKLETINFIDQEIFFTILNDFYIINITCIWINIFFENYIFKELIDYKMLIENITNIYLILNRKILLFKIFDEILNTDNDDLVRQKIMYLSQKLSFDLFMFYDSKKIYQIITNGFIYIKNLLSDETNKEFTKIIDRNNVLLNMFEKNKHIFFYEYDKNKKIFTEIYLNDIELYVKFKIDKNPKITNFIKNIKYIDQL